MRVLFFTLLLVGCADVATTKQTIVTPSGVVTQPNELGELPPGTLATGDNAMMRRQGVIEPRPAFETAFTISGSFPGEDRLVKAWDFSGDQVLTINRNHNGASTSVNVVDIGAATTYSVGYGGPPTFAFSPGKTFQAHVRNRVVLTNDYAPAVIDNLPATTNLTARQAGIPMPAWITASVSTSGSGAWLLDGNLTAYRALYKRRFSDGYIVVGAVSLAVASNSPSGHDAVPQITVYALGTFPLAAGDLIELYRVEQQSEVDLLGDRFRLATVHELSSSEVSAGYATFYDTVYDEQLGADLYTFSEGISKNNYLPPPSSDIFTFKGATFYNSTAEWHSVTVALPPIVSVAGETRGFGGVRSTHTNAITTNLSANITNVVSITGLAVGQVLDVGSGTFPAGAYISSISGSGPYTVTMSAAATASVNPYSFSTLDTIEVNGTKYTYLSFADFMNTFSLAAAAGTHSINIIPSQIVSVDLGSNGVTLTFLEPISGSSAFTIRASNGNVLSPPLPTGGATAQTSTNNARTNRLHFSKIDQPEAVPPANYFFVAHGTILKLWATQDALYAFCSDGIYRIDGDGDQWSVAPADPDTILLSPDAVDSMDNTIYALTTAGLVKVTDSNGVEKISSPLIGDQVRELWKFFKDSAINPLPYTWGVQLVCDPYQSEVWVNFNDYGTSGTGHVQTFIWNVNTNTFFTQSAEETLLLAYSSYFQSVLTDKVVASPASSTVRKYSTDSNGAFDAWMAPTIVFNSIYGDDPGVLKQWIDVTLLLEDWTATGTVTPQFSGTNYSSSYTIAATSGAFEHVIVPLQDYVYNKQLRFGFALGATTPPNWQLKGLTLRYRNASETLRQ